MFDCTIAERGAFRAACPGYRSGWWDTPEANSIKTAQRLFEDAAARLAGGMIEIEPYEPMRPDAEG